MEQFDNLSEEEILAIDKEVKRLLDRYVKPHTKKSREVTNDDIERVSVDYIDMFKLCQVGRGIYRNAYAIAHPQIDDKDPLRFFVVNDGMVFINPEIIRHVNYTVEKDEGCMSFPKQKMKKVNRWHKIVLKFQLIGQDGKLTEPITKDFSGLTAEVLQHEVDHLDAKYIYDISEYEDIINKE